MSREDDWQGICPTHCDPEPVTAAEQRELDRLTDALAKQAALTDALARKSKP